jgi:BirA family biotin operon repressor/biotin-[acetyl-CoA-carboxylase] ligase
MALLEAPIIQLDSIDSTNNYAMQLIDADTAQAGLTIVADVQTHGKGQRGRQWKATPGENLLMSLIIIPRQPLSEQFIFNAIVSAAIADVLQAIYPHWKVNIKWPNDIIVNDKKAGGVLIENVIRGNSWTYSIVGFGLNVNQETFPVELPYATSLKIASGKDFNIAELRNLIRHSILEATSQAISPGAAMEKYNTYLFRKGCRQGFSDNNGTWEGMVVQANPNGTLGVQLSDGNIVSYVHGMANWEWK